MKVTCPFPWPSLPVWQGANLTHYHLATPAGPGGWVNLCICFLSKTYFKVGVMGGSELSEKVSIIILFKFSQIIQCNA